MTETLETLLKTLCKTVTCAQQNNLQTLYVLSDERDARLAYDILAGCGLDAKVFPDPQHHGAKLYVQNASLALCGHKIAAALESAPLLKRIKELVDAQDPSHHFSLSFAHTPAGRQLTLLLPPDRASAALSKPGIPVASKTQTAIGAMQKIEKPEKERLTEGPTVARKAIPKSLKTSTTGEDPLLKRMFFFLSSQAFNSTAWVMFFLFVLAVIFSLVVTVRGFMCPDIAGVQNVPSYCPHGAGKHS